MAGSLPSPAPGPVSRTSSLELEVRPSKVRCKGGQGVRVCGPLARPPPRGGGPPSPPRGRSENCCLSWGPPSGGFLRTRRPERRGRTPRPAPHCPARRKSIAPATWLCDVLLNDIVKIKTRRKPLNSGRTVSYHNKRTFYMRTFAGKPRNLEDHHGEGSAEKCVNPK